MKAAAGADRTHTPAAENVRNHALRAAEEDRANQMQTAAPEDDCIARTDQDIDAAVVVDADTDRGSPARRLAVQHRADAGSLDCSMVRTWW